VPQIDLARQKSVTTNALPVVASAATPIEIDTASEDATLIQWRLPSTTPTAFTVVSSAASGSPTLTTAITNGFSNARIGDVVSGTGITGGSTVTAIALGNQSLTLSASTTAVISAGTITFTPPAITPTLLSIKVNFYKDPINPALAYAGLTFYSYDGSLLGVFGTDLNATKTIPLVTNTSNGSLAQIPLDIEAFYSALRVAKLP
jgi:hypothetical protein